MKFGPIHPEAQTALDILRSRGAAVLFHPEGGVEVPEIEAQVDNVPSESEKSDSESESDEVD